MISQQQQWILLASYLSGEISDVDQKLLDEWVAQSPHNKIIFDEAVLLWRNAGTKLKEPDFDKAVLLNDLRNRIREEDKTRIKFLSGHSTLFKIAAGICIVFVSYFIIRSFEKDIVTIETTNTVAHFYLPDSSEVWLNTNSSLRYERRFPRRLVSLSGEGFFSVRKDTNRFTVNTLTTTTEVLGTAFNLRSETDSAVALTVQHGKVKFSAANDSEAKSIIVNAKEKSLYRPHDKLTKGANNDATFLRWREENNPEFDREKNNPAHFLVSKLSWHKNKINQSVLEGTIRNTASLASYHKIVLAVTYEKADGTPVTTTVKISESVFPGGEIKYKKHLLDIFSNTKSVVTEIKSAEVITNDAQF